MNYRDLYAVLSQDELRNVAGRARLTIEDVRQETLLRCWQIAIGQSDYQPHRGSVRQYIMASLWGLAARETELPTVPFDRTDAHGDGLPHGRRADVPGTTASVLDAILAGEEQQELDRRLETAQRDARQAYEGMSSTAVLMYQGISSGRIALLTGVTPQAVRQRVARERARRAGHRAS